MNDYQTNLYAELLHQVNTYEAFYTKDHTLDGVNYRVFSYRMGSYTEFCQPSALECRGAMFRMVDGEPVELVSLPFKKFFNLYENPMVMTPDFSQVVRFEEKADGCFPYKAEVNLWDGGTERIGKIVHHKIPAKLIGMDEYGNIIPCYVTDFHDNGNKQNWLRLDFERITNDDRLKKMEVTSNHHLYINGEFKAASEAVVGDYFSHQYDDICDDGLHIIKSSLLGDGCITTNSNNYRFTEGHSEPQKGLVDWLHSLLLDVTSGDSRVVEHSEESNHFSNKSMHYVNTTPFPSLTDLRNEWYPNGTKVLPLDLSWVDDFTIAKFYMDDGSIRKMKKSIDGAAFHTNSFSENDNNRLIDLLHTRYGVDARLRNSKNNTFHITINNGAGRGNINSMCKEMHKFWSAIAPYIIDDMLYKLPEEYQNREYQQPPVAKKIKKHIDTQIASIEIVDSNVKGYDISTTTENYHASGVLVHNSLISTYQHNDKMRLKSKTSLGSLMAVDAMEYLEERENKYFAEALGYFSLMGFTIIMEWCDPLPASRIVLAYEKRQLRVFGIRNNANGEIIDFLGGDRDRLAYDETSDKYLAQIEKYAVTSVAVEDAEAFAKTVPDEVGIEGYIMVFANGDRIKQKTNWYLAQHRLKDSVTNPVALWKVVVAEASDDLKSIFHDNAGALELIVAMEEYARPIIQKLRRNVGTFHTENKNLDRRSYAIKGQKDLTKMEFGCAMQLYLTSEVPDYKALLLKNKYAKNLVAGFTAEMIAGVDE